MITKETIMEAYLFLRKENQSVPSETLEFMKDTALAELQKSEVKNLGICSVRQRVLTWWEKLPDNMNGENSKYQLAYKYYDRHWMSLNYREIENIWGKHVA